MAGAGGLPRKAPIGQARLTPSFWPRSRRTARSVKSSCGVPNRREHKPAWVFDAGDTLIAERLSGRRSVSICGPRISPRRPTTSPAERGCSALQRFVPRELGWRFLETRMSLAVARFMPCPPSGFSRSRHIWPPVRFGIPEPMTDRAQRFRVQMTNADDAASRSPGGWYENSLAISPAVRRSVRNLQRISRRVGSAIARKTASRC
jgi:hypothetical protein